MSKPIRRLWLHEIGVFEIIPNSGKGSCLFQAISQALTFSTKFHLKIRTSTVKHMISQKWGRLEELPEFWKHKIIRLWLRRERAHFLEQAMLQENFKGRKTGFKCKRWFDEFIERRRNKKYLEMKQLVESNNSNTYPYLKSFKYIFQQIMSQPHEPGTKYELEAAAHRYRFHFDYLQQIPPKNSQELSKSIHPIKDIQITRSDILNQNINPKLIKKTDKINEMSCENMKDDPQESGKKPPPLAKLEGNMYQFYSCRNNCKLPRGLAPEPYDHYFFLHSPTTSSDRSGGNWDNFGPTSSADVASNECGHWELLLPIYIQKYPVPLNRRMFGISYDIVENERNFVATRSGHRREVPDNVAKGIETYAEKNPSIIPPEDPLWPADDTDDYIGCAASFKKETFCHRSKGCGLCGGSVIGSSTKSILKQSKGIMNQDQEECCWWHGTTRNIADRESIIEHDDGTRTKSNSNLQGEFQPHHHHHPVQNISSPYPSSFQNKGQVGLGRRSLLGSTLIFIGNKMVQPQQRTSRRKFIVSNNNNDDDDDKELME